MFDARDVVSRGIYDFAFSIAVVNAGNELIAYALDGEIRNRSESVALAEAQDNESSMRVREGTHRLPDVFGE